MKPRSVKLRSSVYNGYIERLSRKVMARLEDIEAIYNFELGTDFEVAICHLLSDVLPAKYGVCRGYVVSQDGQTAGDDLIIFDRLHSPVLRASTFGFAAKEQIPVDSVYAYIECKHSISDDITLQRSIEQVRSVKMLLQTRAPNQNPEYEDAGPKYLGKVRDWPRPFPRLRNQPFGIVFARNYTPRDLVSISISDEYSPDLLVLGEDYLVTQHANLGADGIKGAYLVDPRHFAKLEYEHVEGMAYGIAIVTILQVLNWLELLPIDWANGLNQMYWDML